MKNGARIARVSAGTAHFVKGFGKRVTKVAEKLSRLDYGGPQVNISREAPRSKECH
jgi:hypothetical protein